MLLIAFSASNLGSCRAHAADGGASTSDTREPEVVVVTGTRTPEQSQRAAVKTDIVTREEAERRGATNVAEALQTQAGVQVNPGAYGYLGAVSPIQIQGFDLNRVLILEDGEPAIGDIGGAIDLASIPLTDIDRIEIVTGPTSALYGSSAIGGVINIITAPPKQEGGSARGRAEYRTHHGVVAEGAFAYRAGRTWAAVDLGLTREDGIAMDPTLPDLQIPERTRTIVGVRAGTRLRESIDLQVRARWLHQELDGLTSTVYPGLGRFLTDSPETTNRFALHALETVHFGHKSTLRLSLAREDASNNTSTIPQNSPLDQTQRSTERLQSFEATATFADGPRTWVTGTRFEARTFSEQLDQTQNANGTLVSSSTPEVVPHGMASGAVYGQLQWKLGSALTILPGLRAETHGAYGGVIAPRLAIALHPVDSITVRLSGGRGFRTPSAKELGFDFDHSIYGYKILGNPQLSPERSWGVNADANWKPDTHWAFRGGVFANWVDDLIDIDLGAGTSSGTVVTYTYKNFEKVRTFGAQGGVIYRIGETLRTEVAYDYLWTRDDVNDVPLAGRAPHTVTGSVRWAMPARFEIYGRAHVVSGAFVDAATRSPGYETVDLRLSHPLWPSSDAYLGVLNLFDVHQTPGRVGDLRPPLGRVLYAGIRAAFPWEND